MPSQAWDEASILGGLPLESVSTESDGEHRSTPANDLCDALSRHVRARGALIAALRERHRSARLFGRGCLAFSDQEPPVSSRCYTLVATSRLTP